MADDSLKNKNKQEKKLPHRFKKGDPPGPGRPPGSTSDKTVALNIIFKILEEYKSDFETKMRILAKQNIVAYYMKFVAPFQPKDFNINGSMTNTIEVSDDDRKLFKELADSIAKATANIT